MQKVVDYLKQNLNLAVAGLFSIFGLALYANTFVNKMFWDDNDFILNNAFVHSWHFLPQYFSQNIIAGAGLLSNYWRPLLLFVFSIEWHLWGGHVFGYHLVNLLFHIFNALLLYFLFDSLFENKILAILSGLIFLIHPLQTEAVTYVNSLGDSLSVFFVLLSLNNYLYFRRSGNKKAFFWSLGAMVLALLSKETAIIIPLLIGLVEFFQIHKATLVERIKNILSKTWVFFSLGIIYVIARGTILNFQNSFNLYNQQNAFTAHVWVRILTFFRILWVYFGLLFYPHNLHMERSVTLATNFSSDVIFGLLFFGILLAIVIWTYKKLPAAAFGALWFLIALSPTSNIAVPINGLLYEHWLYLPLAGFFLMILSLFFVFPIKTRYFLIPILVIYFIFLSITTIARNRQWHDPIRLYNQTLQYAPDSYRVVNNLGMAYDDNKEFELAENMYQRAITLDPANAVAYHNLGNAYKDQGQSELAAQNFQTAISKDPHFLFSYYALAQLYLDQKKYDQAIATLQNLLKVEPNNSQAQNYIDQINQLKAR